MSRPSTINLQASSNAYPAFPFTNPRSKTLTLWIHDPDAANSLSKHEAVLNYELFPPGMARPGDVAEVKLSPASSGNSNLAEGGAGPDTLTADKMERRSSYVGSFMEPPDETYQQHTVGKEEGRFLFVIRELEDSQRRRNVQLSLATHVAALFGFPSRATVRVTIVDKSQHEASHVEIRYRDEFITRAEMWRLTTSLLADTCPYNSQKLVFIGSIRASVGNVYVRGEKVRCAYFSPRTIPIFRSESARYVIFIQMSREMWHFDPDDGGDGDDADGDPSTTGTGGVGGEIMFNKLVNGFLPELFKRWRRQGSNHLVSIVLFTRVVYEDGEPVGIVDGGKESEQYLGTPGGIELGEGRRYRDFFRVVTANQASADWTIILHKLKREFSVFLRDVLVQPDSKAPQIEDTTPPMSSDVSVASRPSTPVPPVDRQQDSHRVQSYDQVGEPKKIIAGRPSAAMHGNILEAINLATIQFSKAYIDRDLRRTGISVMLVTPGTGYFEVDYEVLKATTEGLIANGMGVDLVCLSKVPLYYVPLLRYRQPIAAPDDSRNDREQARSLPGLSPPKQIVGEPPPLPGDWVYAVPHWIDISFWTAASEKKTRHVRGTFANFERRKQTKPLKSKSLQGFRARCKMYEIQMLGGIENEVACISVPFLHENPLWRALPDEGPPLPIAPGDLAGTKDSERKKKDIWKEGFSWMDEYDELAFKPLSEVREKMKLAEARRSGQEESDKRVRRTLEEEDPLLLGTSYRGDSAKGNSLTRAGFFDRKMRERKPELGSPVETTDSAPPPEATPSTGSTNTGFLGRPARLARQISSGFGLRAWGGGMKAPPKAAATCEVSGPGTITSGLGPGGAIVTRGFDTGDSPKSPLSPRGTIREPKKFDDSPEKRLGSHPISIAGKHAPISLVDNKERRRPFAGSPLDGRGPGGLKDFELLKAASSLSRPAGSRNELVANADKTASIPLTVSPTSALAPWVQAMNPSNPAKNNPSPVNQYRRWHHVFPKPTRTGTVKWKGLCTPAALPLTTEHFPTAEQLATEYNESPYVISQNEDSELMESAGNREELVKAMIALRLTQGFQIVVGHKVAEATQGRGGDSCIYDKNYMVKAGSFCFMSRGSQIHQLIRDEEYNVEVKRYIRKPVAAIASRNSGASDEYISYIKTAMSDVYAPVQASFNQPVGEYNWNFADQYISGYADTLRDQFRYWRGRFILIPSDPPDSARRNQGNGTELNDEEIRLEGIRRLTMTFQRNRYAPPEERHYEKHMGRKKNKEKNPLQILYKTVDPSQVVAQELETLSLADNEGNIRRSQLVVAEPFDSKNMDLKTIAVELQGTRGVRLLDRRWHLKLHSNCFIGEDMVTWILENFKDVSYRSEAEQVGKELLNMGLFQHVDKRHDFRDGNFFYRITDAFASPTSARPSSKGGWFGNFRPDKSVPSTPLSDVSSPLHHPAATRSRSSTLIPGNDESSATSPISQVTSSALPEREDLNRTPSTIPSTTTPTGSKSNLEVTLSKAMKYDVDPSRRSYRPEIVTLHYDRLHNPDNCYHIRLEWMNTTAKLIEDCVTSWARTVDRYGLKLVEAPINEIANMSANNLFRSPSILPLACPPPEPREYYQRQLLKHFNFVLDMEAASNFPPDVKVKYSWGPNAYTYSQYVHRSGRLFAEVNDEGELLLVANRALTDRIKGKGKEQAGPGGGATGGGNGGKDDLEKALKDAIEKMTSDAERLRKFWDEVTKKREESLGMVTEQTGLVFQQILKEKF